MRVAALLFAGVVSALAAVPAVATEPVRDPFESFARVGCQPACIAVPGVLCVPLAELSLKAVVVGVPSPRAAFEDRAGRSHVLKVGDVVDGLKLSVLRNGQAIFRPVGRVGADVVVHLRAPAPAPVATTAIGCTDG